MNEDNSENTALIRSLNDQFRCSGVGRGSVMVTQGVQAAGTEFVAEAVAAVRRFDTFDEGDDPWQEHDFGSVIVDCEKLIWKIDYYDLALTAHSPNPADEAVTHRVLTIMLAREY